MRKLLPALLAVLFAVPFPSAASATGGPTLSPVGGERFPERSYVLTLPKRVSLRHGQVRVTENGGPVRSLRVEPVGAARRSRLGVVLVIDTSSSMRGAPLAGALGAVRAFTLERNERQPLGLVTFNSGSDVALRPTTDPWDIRAALLRRWEAGGKTHVYDAGRVAVDLIRHSRLPGGFVVVLSDGSDTGSSTSAKELAAAARAAHVRLYTVGLRSRHFDPSALRRLATASGGAYSEASSARQLEGIYSALGAELSNSYVVQYRSLAGPEEPIYVRVSVEGVGSAGGRYTTPPLDVDVDARGESGWSSRVAVVAVVALFGLLLAAALFALFSLGRKSARQRVAEFVAPQPSERRVRLTDRLEAGTERSLSSAGWWGGLELQLDVAGYSWAAPRVVAASVGSALALGVLLTAATGTALAGLAALVALPLGVRTVVRMRAERTRRRFADQLADHLSVVGSALRAGHSLAAALASVVDEAPEPTRREFERVTADEQLGAPLEEALSRLAQRMDNRDIEQVATLAMLQREAGADAAEMLDTIVHSIRERQELRRTIRTLTSQGRLARWILSILPVTSLLFMTLVEWSLVAPLYETQTGHVLLALAAALVVAGSLVIKRIVELKV